MRDSIPTPNNLNRNQQCDYRLNACDRILNQMQNVMTNLDIDGLRNGLAMQF